MFRADSFLGNRSRTLDEILAAKRSWPNAGRGCSFSAAAKNSVAGPRDASLATVAERRGAVALTVARCAAHPQPPNRTRTRPKLIKLWRLSSGVFGGTFIATSFSSDVRPTFQKMWIELKFLLVWNVNELGATRAKHLPNANDTCGRGRDSGDARRYDRNE
jgi:hypothetical protein